VAASFFQRRKEMIIKNADIVLPESIKKNYSLLIEDGIITQITPSSIVKNGHETIDLQGRLVLPGFIDLHTHGIGGYDVMDAAPHSLEAIGDTLIKFGVTSFLPTILTESKEVMCLALDNIRSSMSNSSGARVLGVHVEGPFFSHEYRGAQNPAYLLEGTLKNYTDIFYGYEDIIKVFSLAPEVTEEGVITHLTDNDIVAAMAHTSATATETKKAISLGVCHLVHTFNGMKPLHHREPSCVGISLIDDRVYSEVILDGVHINPDIFKLIYRCKGEDRVLLVSDSMRATGLEDGSYELGGQEVVLKGSVARLKGGSLAGSTLTLDKAFKNAVTLGDLGICQASKLVSKNPANHLKLKKVGEIKMGYYADLIIMNEDLDIDGVISRGVLITNNI